MACVACELDLMVAGVVCIWQLRPNQWLSSRALVCGFVLVCVALCEFLTYFLIPNPVIFFKNSKSCENPLSECGTSTRRFMALSTRIVCVSVVPRPNWGWFVLVCVGLCEFVSWKIMKSHGKSMENHQKSWENHGKS